MTSWLTWWAQFSKINDDEDLHATDKFQYLLQSMVSGTRAYDIVKGYPMTAANYPKAVEKLPMEISSTEDTQALGAIVKGEFMDFDMTAVLHRDEEGGSILHVEIGQRDLKKNKM